MTHGRRLEDGTNAGGAALQIAQCCLRSGRALLGNGLLQIVVEDLVG